MRRTQVLDRVILDPSLSLDQKGLYSLLTVLCKEKPSIGMNDVMKEAGCARPTLRRHLATLSARGVVRVGEGKGSSITLAQFFDEQAKEMVAAIIRRLAQARSRIRNDGSKESVGEALMKEWLTLLIDSRDFTNNARPGFLISPMTGEPLEYDRWYPGLKLAWEFQGPQHFGTSDQQPDPSKQARQENNDLVKIGISQRKGIALVEMVAEDLCQQRIEAKIPPGVPRRSLEGLESVVAFLETESAKYQQLAGLRRVPPERQE